MSKDTAPTASPRQLKLFQLESPLTLRFGSEFFRTLPQSPGVYFFYDGEGQLLYIGQSSDLQRIHPPRGPACKPLILIPHSFMLAFFAMQG